MRRTEGVVRAFAALRKTGNAVGLAQRGHCIAPAGENLVGISLVANVPNNGVFGGVENVMKRDCQFRGTERTRQVTARLADAFDHEIA